MYTFLGLDTARVHIVLEYESLIYNYNHVTVMLFTISFFKNAAIFFHTRC